MCHLINNQQNDNIKDYSESYLRNKPPDCVLYSEDGAEFYIQKELLGQTKFMRELLKNTNCCNTLEIICPCSKEELGQIIHFLRHGKIECVDEKDFSKFLENLNKILGFS